MDEWITNGCRLGWLLFPKEEKAWVYRANDTKEVHGFDQTLSGEDALPGFVFELHWLK